MSVLETLLSILSLFLAGTSVWLYIRYVELKNEVSSDAVTIEEVGYLKDKVQNMEEAALGSGNYILHLKQENRQLRKNNEHYADSIMGLSKDLRIQRQASIKLAQDYEELQEKYKEVQNSIEEVQHSTLFDDFDPDYNKMAHSDKTLEELRSMLTGDSPDVLEKATDEG